MRWLIGLTSTNVSSQPGSVSGATKMFDRNTSGNSSMKPVFMTALGARISRPIVVNAHERPNANTAISPTAATTPSTPPSASKPMINPSATTITDATT